MQVIGIVFGIVSRIWADRDAEKGITQAAGGPFSPSQIARVKKKLLNCIGGRIKSCLFSGSTAGENKEEEEEEALPSLITEGLFCLSRGGSTHS